MTISHARILSSENKSFNTANATVNLTVQPSTDEIKLEYPSKEENPYDDVDTNENIYKQIADAHINNPIVVNKYVVMKNDKLIELIKSMTNADKVEIEISTDVSCCGKPTDYNTIESIIVVKNGLRNDFKIGYNQQYRLLKDYHISTKLTKD